MNKVEFQVEKCFPWWEGSHFILSVQGFGPDELSDSRSENIFGLHYQLALHINRYAFIKHFSGQKLSNMNNSADK